jgi:hypothetical protein
MHTIEYYPAPDVLKKMIIENPKIWPSVYLSYIAAHFPEYLNVKFTDN